MNWHLIFVSTAWLAGEAAGMTMVYLWSHAERDQKGWAALSALTILAIVCTVLAGVVK